MTATMTNENMTVRMYKGEDVCHECGRPIRNIVEIDGVAFGIRCCEKYLPRTHKVIKGAVVQVETPLETARRIFADSDEIFNRFWGQPLWALEKTLAGWTPDRMRYAGVQAIINAKRAAVTR